ncbi:MAG: Omp28-related outer membrane protein, partial [Bacteroidaceae bacterium]|nr:Omp28-related outer membrane protein [Bacteroidaceae bacterium]
APYGDDISMTAGSRQTVCYEYQLNDMWDTSQLYVVAFIYNDSDGVLQAEKAKCK